jgi:hypothetical protein
VQRVLTILTSIFVAANCVADPNDWAAIRVLSIDYPVLALSAQVSGVIHLQVLLNNEGAVTGFHTVSGSLVLVKAAEQKVRYWRFSRLKGIERPASATAEVTVIFKIVLESQRSTLTRFVYEYPGTAIVTGIAPHAEP